MKRLSAHTLLISLIVASGLAWSSVFADSSMPADTGTVKPVATGAISSTDTGSEYEPDDGQNRMDDETDPNAVKIANDNLAFALDNRPRLRTMTQGTQPGQASSRLEFISLPHIFFNHDDFTLNKEARDILDGAAQFVFENDTTVRRVMIQSHSSDIADQNYNYRLSDRRAYAVWDYLAGVGVPIEIIAVKSWGEDHPIDENWTRNGRERNRHVEIQLVRATPLPDITQE